MSRRSTLSALAFVALASVMAWRAGAQSWGQLDPGSLSPAAAQLYAQQVPYWFPALNSTILAYAFLGAAALFTGGKLLLGVGRGLLLFARRGRWTLGEQGQAMTETAVSFPVLLITTLIMMQLALMYQAKNVVTYAAFSAARAAVAYIGSENDSEEANQINMDGGDKLDKIHQAAAMACVPISPRASVVLSGLPFIGDILADAFSAFSSMMSALPAGVEIDNALQRYGYSTFATEVQLYQATAGGMTEVSSGVVDWPYPGPDVGVMVRHRYYLPIPVVNRFIGDSWSLISLPPLFSLDLPGQYTFIRAVAVLPAEGVIKSSADGGTLNGFWD
jgi:hypothetical protein